jgi:creatinine amidohydrolase
MMLARDFGALSTTDIAERITRNTIVILPVGAMEQHGPHLPLATDLLTADALARTVTEQYGEDLDLLVLPPIAFSKSNEHDPAPGTITLRTETMLRVLDDLGRSLRYTPLRRLALLNGHGGNSSLLDVACRDLRVAHGFDTFLLHTLLPPDQGGPVAEGELGLGIHAGRDETSLMLHLNPETVDMSRGERTIPEWLNSYKHISVAGPVRFGWRSEDLSPSGVMGDPTLASAEEGATLFAGMVAATAEQLAEISQFEFGKPSGRSVVGR